MRETRSRNGARWAVVAILAVCATASVFASPTNYPRGTTRLNQSRMAPGWVLFTASDGNAYLVDQNGLPANRWSSPDPENPILGYSEPLFDRPGNILTLITSPVLDGCELPDCGQVMELDWDGNLVWEYVDTERAIHHDFERLPNGNTLMLCARTIFRPEIAPAPIVDDCVIEVSPDGEVVWEWQTADHYDELQLSDEERRLIAAGQEMLEGDWSHGNALDSIGADTPHTDERFREGNILLSYRHLNLMIIVDRDTGEVVWQHRSTIGQHHTTMIEAGLEGHGNILAFDNGLGGQYPPLARFHSRVVEIDPTTHETVYEYTAVDSGVPLWTFYSAFVGSAQRLPNGNTLVGEGMFGRVFEVAPTGEMVWEFINPTFNLVDGVLVNTVYRFTKVPVGWAGPLDASLAWPSPEEISTTEAPYLPAPGSR